MKLQLLGWPDPDDRVDLIEGNADERRFIAAYERDGRTVAVLSANEPVRLQAYRTLVAERVPFPPRVPADARAR